jgi:hypothetical protein
MMRVIVMSVFLSAVGGLLGANPQTTLVLTGRAVGEADGPVVEVASETISAGPSYLVGPGADVRLAAGQRIALRPGFAVQSGATFGATASLRISEQLTGETTIDGPTYVFGTLTVLGSSSLILRPGARIVFLSGEPSGLIVYGTLMADNAVFTSKGTGTVGWSGIRVLGPTAFFTDCTIELAQRGITLAGATTAVSVTRCALVDCLIGIHLASGTLLVHDTRFERNEW